MKYENRVVKLMEVGDYVHTPEGDSREETEINMTNPTGTLYYEPSYQEDGSLLFSRVDDPDCWVDHVDWVETHQVFEEWKDMKAKLEKIKELAVKGRDGLYPSEACQSTIEECE